MNQNVITLLETASRLDLARRAPFTQGRLTRMVSAQYPQIICENYDSLHGDTIIEPKSTFTRQFGTM